MCSYDKMSLVQQHKHLLLAVHGLFDRPCLGSSFPVVQQVAVHSVTELSQLRLTTLCSSDKFMMSFVDRLGAHHVLHYAEISYRTEQDYVKKSAFKYHRL
jgi:hypothetical protein